MVCVAAFILVAAQNSQDISRLVFAVNDFSYPNYGVFKLPRDGQFPEPKDHSIITTDTVVDGPGTYVQIYCSHRWHDYNIIGKISEELEDITENAISAFESPTEHANNCLAAIQESELEKSSSSCNPLARNSGAKLSKVKTKSCTPKIVADLAFKGLLDVRGKYRHFVPPTKNRLPRIQIDEKIKLSNLVYESSIYRGRDWDKHRRALAWYQGHLHIFEKFETDPQGWLPFTDLGLERQNGDLIYIQLYDNHKGFSEIHDKLVKYLQNAGDRNTPLESRLRDPAFLDYVDNNKHQIQQLIGNKVLDKLAPASIRNTHDYIRSQKLHFKSIGAKKIQYIQNVDFYPPKTSRL